MNDSQKHHYIPRFYLARWAGADGRLCEFSRPHKTVVPDRKFPKATGYAKYLYRVPDAPERDRDAVEQRFMKKVDDLGARAMQMLYRHDTDFTEVTKSGWARFIMSLLHRNPEKVEWAKRQFQTTHSVALADIKERYAEYRLPHYPSTFEEYRAQLSPATVDIAALRLIQEIVDQTKVGRLINEMTWNITTIPGHVAPFLTSDRPVIISRGIAGPSGYILVPIGPRTLFSAVPRTEAEAWLRLFNTTPPNDLSFAVNNEVATQAARYVWGVDDGAWRFVEGRLGLQPPQFIGPASGSSILRSSGLRFNPVSRALEW